MAVTKRTRYNRWTVADLLNRLPWICWADIVDWALQADQAPSRQSSQHLIRTSRDGETSGLLRMNSASRCRADAAKTGTCYCGKFCTRAAQIQSGLTGSIVVEPSDS